MIPVGAIINRPFPMAVYQPTMNNVNGGGKGKNREAAPAAQKS
jgi:hypothetical protein